MASQIQQYVTLGYYATSTRPTLTFAICHHPIGMTVQNLYFLDTLRVFYLDLRPCTTRAMDEYIEACRP